MDSGGTVTALDAVSGERRWTAELDGKAAGFVGGTLVVLQDQTAHGLDPATGRRRWLRPFTGTFTELATFTDRLVVATQSATVLLDETGAGDRPAPRLPAGDRRHRPDGRLGGPRGRAGRPGRDGQPTVAAARPDRGSAGPARPSGRPRVSCCSVPTGPSRPGTMSADASTQQLAAPVDRRFRHARPVRFVTGVLRQTLVDPVAAGRLRNLDWPYGLSALVVAGVRDVHPRRADSGRIRVDPAGGNPDHHRRATGRSAERGRLAVGGAAVLRHGRLPDRCAAWAVVAEGARTAFRADDQRRLVAAQPGAKRRAGLAGGGVPWCWSPWWSSLFLRWRRRFAWWEFAVVWALVGAAMAIGVGAARQAKRFGFDVTAQLLQQTAWTFGYLALPAAILAGAAVAEVTVRATVAATRNATRLAHHRWPLVILAGVLLVRGVQAVREWQRPGPGQPRAGRLCPRTVHHGRIRGDRRRRAPAQPAHRGPAGGVGAGGRAGRRRVRHRRRAGRHPAAVAGADRGDPDRCSRSASPAAQTSRWTRPR